MKKRVLVGSIILALVICVTLFYINKESEFMTLPERGSYALVIYVSKSSGVKKLNALHDAITANVLPGEYYDGPWLKWSNDDEYVYYRINRSGDFNPMDMELYMIKVLDELGLEEDSEFAIIYGSDSGGMITTGGFRPEVFP